ncbi:hypothetical protein SaccyDRAFT_3204 [Saccharomonospora cyanea NA-134]|uniref:Uncharacterized protein n=1 Tax=Saccharomonospora cyanea NA-134 TaxID=882082 RepID=H5XLZ8_9PSEU|nr:hypothetical protein SaccyDRAFT_3204 [Saccharomonospora cyanea NA-134]
MCGLSMTGDGQNTLASIEAKFDGRFECYAAPHCSVANPHDQHNSAHSESSSFKVAKCATVPAIACR